MRISGEKALASGRTRALLPALVFPFIIGVAIGGSTPPPSFQEVPNLQLNQPLSNHLKDNESHTYKLYSQAQMLVRVMVMQQGVDVAVEALDGQRKRLARANDSFGRVGPQLLEFAADTTGEYFVTVIAARVELGGAYEIKFIGTRPMTADDRTRLAANELVLLANGLRSRAEDKSNRQALIQYDRALALYKRINDKAGQATSLQYKARIFEAQSDYKRALEYYSAALALWREVGDRRGEAYAVRGMGSMHLYLGNLDVALPYFQKAIEIHREVGNKEGEALGNHEIANIHFQKGDIAAALESYGKALNLYREVGTRNFLGYLLSNMGVAYRDIGDLKRAVDYQNQALEIWRELNQKHGVATGLTMLASIYSQQGELRKALAFYQQAVPLCVAGGEQDCEARAYSQMASVYDGLGETQAALDHYAKAAAIYRNRAQTVGLARMLNSAGALYSSLGEKTRAREFHNEALVLSRRTQSRLDEATALSNLAELHADKGETPKARELYQQALLICREIRNRQGEATNLNRLGLLAHAAGNKPEAIRFFEQALAINNELGTRNNGALALNNLGVVYDGSGDSRLALDYFTKALEVFRALENKNSEAMMLFRVASVQKKLGRIAEARRNITSALEIVETIRGKIASTDLRSSYFATVQDYYDLYIELLMSEHRTRPEQDLSFSALQISEQARSRSLLDLLQEAKAELRQSVDAKLSARERELLELLNGKAAQQALAFNDPKKAELAKALGQEINGLAIEYETVQSNIRASNPNYAELVRAQPMTLAEIQGLLDTQTVLLEYKLGETRSYMWLVSQSGLESFELPSRAEIEASARQLYELITERNRMPRDESPAQKRSRIQGAEQKLQIVSDKLNRMLLGPVISSVGDKRLVVVADGALQYVPFSVLVNAGRSGANGSLVRANEVVKLPSIAVLDRLHRENVSRQSPVKGVAVFADPVFESDDPRLPAAARKRKVKSNIALMQSQSDFDFGENGGGLPRLLASREEAKAILALAPRGTNYGALDFEANRERATSADLNQYRILHFATHALLNTSRPQLSGIVLSLYDEKGKERDGFLRLNQIYNLRLSSDLVVLSACSTALGKEVRGEGLIGLTRGFMYAGVPRVVASLWKVDDEATAELMKVFYSNLLREGMPAAAALTAAQVEIQKQERWHSPYYWGAFVLQGDWR